MSEKKYMFNDVLREPMSELERISVGNPGTKEMYASEIREMLAQNRDEAKVKRPKKFKKQKPFKIDIKEIKRLIEASRADGGIMRATYNKAGLVDKNEPLEKVKSGILEKILKNQPKKIDKEAEIFKTVEEFKKLKLESDNPFFRNMDFSEFREIKNKQKNLFTNKLIELNLKYPDKKFINEEGFINKELAKETIDKAIGELEISPIEGLSLVKTINTQGNQSDTSGVFNIGNFTFTSPSLEKGILQTDAALNFGDLKKEFDLPKNFKVGVRGDVDTFTIDGKTYRGSDLTPSLSYDDGILSAILSKEILEGGSKPNLDVALNKGGFYAKGSDLLSEDRSGKVGFEKTVGDTNKNLFYTVGGEIDPFSGEKTAGAGIKLKFAKGGLAAMLGE